MRFVLFKGQSQYGSLRLHVDQLAAALSALAHEVRVVDLTASDGAAQANAAFADPADCYFGFSGVGTDIRAGDRSVYDVIGKTYASIYVDHPLHHVPRLSQPIARNVALFLDRTHVQFMTAWSRGRTFSQLGFLPPGANERPEPPDLSDEAFTRRDIGFLFTGTHRGPPLAPWRDEADSPARAVVEDIAQRMAADARIPVLDALKASLKALYSAELTPDLFEEFIPLLQAPQAFAEAYHRNRLIEALGAAGIPLTVYGSGWEPVAARFPSFTYGGVGSFEETLDLLRRTRLVLNTNNGFVAGGHERVFTAMCAGAAVISDESRYYADAFKAGREITTFAWDRIDKVPGVVSDLLADPARLGAIARAGARKAQAEHTWTQRAARLVKVVKQVG